MRIVKFYWLLLAKTGNSVKRTISLTDYANQLGPIRYIGDPTAIYLA